MKILITGGAGFVGSFLARAFKEDESGNEVTVMDNLKRAGSELNRQSLQAQGIRFVHGDIRSKSDFDVCDDKYDLLVEASAEPSVHAGRDGNPSYLLETNLIGTLNCLEFARLRVAKTIFLSTSRVFAVESLKNIPLLERESRFDLDHAKIAATGLSGKGISEDFNTNGYRSLYGATKLASEIFCQEYAFNYGTKVLINRAGVIAGPGQFGKVDQGVFTMWVAHHVFNKPLSYFGFGGLGKQVRDLLHPADLFQLLKKQISGETGFDAEVYNVGGGLGSSSSLCEFTGLCRLITGNKVDIASDSATNPVDVPYYVTDFTKAQKAFGWTPKLTPQDIAVDIHRWIEDNRTVLTDLFR